MMSYKVVVVHGEVVGGEDDRSIILSVVSEE